MRFEPGDRRKDVHIPIINDGCAEPEEDFSVELEIPPKATNDGVVAVEPTRAQLSIRDDDSKK